MGYPPVHPVRPKWRLAMRKLAVVSALAASSLLGASPALAAEIAFGGSMTGSATVAPSAGCAPIPFQGIISAGSGTSSFGDFTYSHTVCTQGPPGGPVVGTYTIDFGDDEFVGALSGISQGTDTPTIFELLLNYTITGGTGRFAGATGAFTGLGTADTSVRPSIVSLNFAAVPEPGTWGMMIIGFGALGMAMRRRRETVASLAQSA